MTHDYDPSWDYDVVTAPSWWRYPVRHSLVEEVRKALRLGPLQLFTVKNLGRGEGKERSHAARYVNGTSSGPVIVFDIGSFKKFQKSRELPTIQVGLTLHELGHAFFDSVGHHPKKEEDIVEQAAMDILQGELYPDELVRFYMSHVNEGAPEKSRRKPG